MSYVEVTDAEPALVSLAWQEEGLRPTVEAFIEVARKTAADVDPNGLEAALAGFDRA